jgi:FkbM family methyltransferase
MNELYMISRIENLFNTLAVLQYPGAFRAFLTSKAFSTPCFRLNQALKSHQHSFGVILDVGANVGQFALAAAIYFPDTDIYSFEPLPEAFAELTKNINGKERIKAFNTAVGDKSGKIPFYRNHYSRLSSSRQIDNTNDNPRYRERKITRTTVNVVRLDSLSEVLNVQPPVLLKLDVQGMEREVLLGCGGLLDQIDFILCELPLVRLYADQPLFDEMHSFIRNLGYRLAAPLYLNKGKEGRVIEVDVLYARCHT